MNCLETDLFHEKRVIHHENKQDAAAMFVSENTGNVTPKLSLDRVPLAIDHRWDSYRVLFVIINVIVFHNLA